MEHYEMRLLADYVGGALAADTWVRPTPLAVGGELERDERGEVVYAEIFSPVTLGGDDECLKKVVLVADGQEVPYIHLSGILRNVMAPPKDRIWAGKLYSFGTPGSSNPLLNTTIKYRQNITVACLCGAADAAPAPASPITVAYRIRLWGYVYKESELAAVFGSMVFPAYAIERTRNRTLVLTKAPIIVNGDSWLTLPGGKDQSVPKVSPFVRYAYNVGVTGGLGGDYPFRFGTGNVLEEDENMYWEFDDKDALIIEGLGIKADMEGVGAPNTLASVGLRIDGDYHPKGPTTATSLFPTTLGINERNYGHLAPYAPVAHPYFAAIPKLAKPLMIWNEIGMVVIRDDTTGNVIARDACVALTGVRIEMRG